MYLQIWWSTASLFFSADQLWTAPEILRSVTLMNKGTYKADVYSFAIIMQEVISRATPFCMLDMPAKGLTHLYIPFFISLNNWRCHKRKNKALWYPCVTVTYAYIAIHMKLEWICKHTHFVCWIYKKILSVNIN